MNQIRRKNFEVIVNNRIDTTHKPFTCISKVLIYRIGTLLANLSFSQETVAAKPIQEIFTGSRCVIRKQSSAIYPFILILSTFFLTRYSRTSLYRTSYIVDTSL